MSTPEPPRSIRCPKCQSFDMRRSYPAGLWDAIMRARNKVPLRCRRCGYRYYRKLEPGETLGLPEIALPPIEPFTAPPQTPQPAPHPLDSDPR